MSKTADSFKKERGKKRNTKRLTAKERMGDLLEKLEDGVKNFRYDPEVYKAILEMKALMPSYSFQNILVAKRQMPHASYIASFKRWNELGRKVNKGQKAIWIFAPNFRKKKETVTIDGVSKEVQKSVLSGFTSVPVFDMSQTDKIEGAIELPLDRVKLELKGESKEARRIMNIVQDVCTIPIDYKDAGDANGYYDLVNDCIVVEHTLSENHKAKTLVHEYCHSMVHGYGKEDVKSSKIEKEVVAEGVAFVICSYFGLDTSDYSFGYIKSWSKDNGETLKAYGNKICSIAGRIISKMEKATGQSNESGQEKAS